MSDQVTYGTTVTGNPITETSALTATGWNVKRKEPGGMPYYYGYGTNKTYRPEWQALAKYIAPSKTAEIIGLLSSPAPVLLQNTDASSLTATTFDYTTRAESARILLTNDTGATRTVYNVAIRALPVTRLGGEEGWIHDKFVDYESIAKNGERKFELGNRFTVTFDQVNKLADYHWKWNRAKHHLYSLTLPGMLSYFEPGEWYGLEIGSAGEEEYISASVFCYAVRCFLDADGNAQTQLTLQNGISNWKHDSNYVARFIASGGQSRILHDNYVFVAPSTYTGTADVYCDGTADQTEINAAIIAASKLGKNAIVHLLRGTFNLTSTITMVANVILEGSGQATVLKKNANDYNIYSASNGIVIRDLRIEQSDTNSKANIFFHTITDCQISNVYFEAPYYYGIHLNSTASANCDKILIEKCTFNDPKNTAIYGYKSNRTTINDNLIPYASSTTFVKAIYLSGVNNTVTNNKIGNITSTASSLMYIMELYGEGMVISGNIIKTITSSKSVTCIHIDSTADYTIISDNVIDTVTTDVTAESMYGVFVNGSTYCKVQGNIFKDITNSNASGIGSINAIIDSAGSYNTYQNNTIRGMTATSSNGLALGRGFNMNGTDLKISGNIVTDCERGIFLNASVRAAVVGNTCYNNGSDTGLANTNSHNYVDSGTSSMTSANTWELL